MKDVVLRFDYRRKQEVIQTVHGHSGFVHTEDMKLTVRGKIDPVSLASKLMNLRLPEIVSGGARKPPEKRRVEKRRVSEKVVVSRGAPKPPEKRRVSEKVVVSRGAPKPPEKRRVGEKVGAKKEEPKKDKKR